MTAMAGTEDGTVRNHKTLQTAKAGIAPSWLDRMRDKRVTLAHGSGGKAMRELGELGAVATKTEKSTLRVSMLESERWLLEPAYKWVLGRIP